MAAPQAAAAATRLERTVDGRREGQAIEFVPLDTRLQLPAGAFSYVLQDWDQDLAVEQAFSRGNESFGDAAASPGAPGGFAAGRG